MKTFFYQQMLSANYQAKIWYDFTSPTCPSGPLNYCYAIDRKLLLPAQYPNDACPEVLNQLCIEDKYDVESNYLSDEEYSGYKSSNDDDDDNGESDNNG